MAEEFDPLRYIASYPDLIQAFGADAEAGRQHWLTHGQAEGRNPFLFNPFMYGASHSDLVAAFGTNYAAYTTHYIQYGFAEGRATSSFDYLGYSASNEDLLVVYGTDPTALARHYLEFGHSEGRSFSRFDPLIYAASNSDVAAAYGDDRAQILTHYIHHGYYEHRPTSGFDPVEYVAANRDLLDFGYLNYPQDALYHYLQTGADEGRPTDFDERAYLLTYADLAGHHLSEGAALNHWINSGVHEGRVGDTLFGHDQATHALPVGGTAVAAIDFANDRDWFELNLAQGAFHSLLTTNADGSVRPATITLHDQYGVPIASRIVKTGDVSGLDFTASYAGRYFVVVTSEQTGAYRLTDSENATGTMTIGGRNYTDADFAGVQGIRYLVLTDHYSVELGPNAQAAGIRVVTATSNLASVIDASAYTVGLTVDVSAGGGDTVITGSGNDHVIAGAGAQNLSLGAGDDLVTGAVSTAHTISGGDGTDTIRVTGNVLLDLTKFSDVERIEQGDGKLWLRLTTSGPVEDAAYTIVGNGSYEYHLVGLEVELTQPNIDFTILAAPGGTQFYRFNNGTANGITFVGGDGLDIVQVSLSGLRPDGSIDGGGGEDWYSPSDMLLVDADFERVHNMEVLFPSAYDLTLGHIAAASGLTTINLETSTETKIVFQADYTGAIEVTMTRTGFFSRETGDELSHVIDASLSPVQLTVSAWDSEIQSGEVIRGGTGSLDVLNIDYSIFTRPTVGTIDATPLDLANVSGIETVNITVTGDSLRPQTHGWVFIDTAPGDLDGTTVQTINVVGARGNPEDLLTAPIDASLATADLVINGAYRVKSGSGNDTITGSQAWRSILEGGAGNDTINGGTLADQLFGGIGNDVLYGADGSDAIDLGSGTDRLLYRRFSDTAGGPETVAGFTSGDDVVDVTGLTSVGYFGETIDFLGNAATLAAAQALLTPGDATFDAVFQQDTQTLWFDNGDGQLDPNDLRIVLTGVTSLTGADVLEGSVIIG